MSHDSLRCSCHWCGPPSLRNGVRRPEFECSTVDPDDGKFAVADYHLYVSCKCNRKITLECLDGIVRRLKAMDLDLRFIHDPKGMIAALSDNVHRDPHAAARHASFFSPSTSTSPARFLLVCPLCENEVMPVPEPRVGPSFFDIPPDDDTPVQLLVPVTPLFHDGTEGGMWLRHHEVVHMYSRIVPASAELAFRGGSGERQEVGGVHCHVHETHTLPRSHSRALVVPTLIVA